MSLCDAAQAEDAGSKFLHTLIAKFDNRLYDIFRCAVDEFEQFDSAVEWRAMRDERRQVQKPIGLQSNSRLLQAQFVPTIFQFWIDTANLRAHDIRAIVMKLFAEIQAPRFTLERSHRDDALVGAGALLAAEELLEADGLDDAGAEVGGADDAPRWQWGEWTARHAPVHAERCGSGKSAWNWVLGA